MQARRWVSIGIAVVALGWLAPSALAEGAGSGARAYQADRVAAGESHSCAIAADGSTWCWGADISGQLGDDAISADKALPVRVALPAGRTALAIVAGGSSTCARLDDGTAWCWGDNGDGELGNGSASGEALLPVQVLLPVGRTARWLTLGSRQACAILDDGTAWCWGDDTDGALGDDATIADRAIPTRVALPPGRSALAIASGGDHTCAILDDRSAWCWGEDNGGQLGDDVALAGQPVPVPVALPTGRSAVAITAGGDHTCAILDDASAWCWGEDNTGQLGDDATLLRQPLPVPVALPPARTAVAIGASDAHTCAILDTAGLRCWGSDGNGQLGDDATTATKPTPVAIPVPGAPQTVAVEVAGEHTCATLRDGSLLCWGSDQFERLGNGSAGDQADASAAPLALPTGTMVGLVADVSVALEGVPATLALGAGGQVTVRVANAGPDGATGTAVALSQSLLALGTGAASLGVLNGTTWDVGALPVGSSEVLLLPFTAAGPGTATLVAELAAAVERDSDSTPANGAESEDDRASASVVVPAPPPPPPPPPAPAPPPAPPALPTLTLTKLSLARTTFRIAGVALRNRKTTVKAGTSIKLTLSLAATITVKVGKLTKTGSYTSQGQFTLKGKAGAATYGWDGRLSKKALPPASYRLTVTATASGKTTPLQRVTFKIVAP